MPASIGAPELSSAELSDTLLIWEKARDAASSFLAAFTQSRRARGSPRGTSTDAEQDMLRAALVFAGAGLDAVVKQLLADAGEQLITPACRCQRPVRPAPLGLYRSFCAHVASTCAEPGRHLAAVTEHHYLGCSPRSHLSLCQLSGGQPECSCRRRARPIPEHTPSST